MLKIFMNEPYSTEHELIQAKRLVELLNESYADDEHAWLCLNFSFGGKALDGAFITPECFTIIEFKAVGGDVYCGDSIESSTWKWKLYPHDLGQSISTSPYANPYSQVKCYRTALIGDLAQRQQGFIGKKRLLKEDVDFAKWVGCCVLLSRRDATDVNVIAGELSFGTKKWFSCGSLGNVVELLRGRQTQVSIAPKEVSRLIGDVFGLQKVDHVLEEMAVESSVPDQNWESPISTNSSSVVEHFNKRYGGQKKTVAPKVKKVNVCLPEHSDSVVNDFADIDRLLAKAESVEITLESNTRQDNVVVAGSPKSYGFLKMALSGEMAVVASDYGSVRELDGEAAVTAVLESSPDIGPFEVSKVLRFGSSIPAEKKEEILEYFEQKYSTSRQWYRVAYCNGNVDFIFGQQKKEASKKPLPSVDSPYERPISDSFLVPRWIKALIEKNAEGLSLLSADEVQITTGLSADDVLRYAKTYFPRSCAESFVITDWMLGNETIPHGVSVLDVGCGSGGALLGCLLALHKHGTDDKHEIRMLGLDVNDNSLSFADDLFKKAKPLFPGRTLTFLSQHGDITSGIDAKCKFDIIIASKSIGEVALAKGDSAYAETVFNLSTLLSVDGMLLMIDLPKHRNALEATCDRIKGCGFDGWTKELSISLQGVEDSEDFICACFTHRTIGAQKE